MTGLNFGDALVENAFSNNNEYNYYVLQPFGLYFDTNSENYPYILRGGLSDTVELGYANAENQLRGRLLNTKKIKEIMDTSKLPIIIRMKDRLYLIGKGFLSTFDSIRKDGTLLFVACVDNRKQSVSMEDIRFFVSKKVYAEEHKPFHSAIKDFTSTHPGDVVFCNNILNYISEKITMPRGGSVSRRLAHRDAVVKAAIETVFVKPPATPDKDLPF